MCVILLETMAIQWRDNGNMSCNTNQIMQDWMPLLISHAPRYMHLTDSDPRSLSVASLALIFAVQVP